MKAVAIGVGVWLGIHVAAFVLVALGVLLYYALMVALIIAGALAIEALFQKRFSIKAIWSLLLQEPIQKWVSLIHLLHFYQ